MSAIPTTPKGRRTREHLLVAARRVFGRDGYVNARMQDIAGEAGTSLGGLYRYFKNKEDVFAALIADTHDELYRSSQSHDHHLATEPYEALLEANAGYLQHYCDNRDVMRTLVEAAHVDERFRDFWWEMRDRHTARFLVSLGRTPDAGRMTPDERRLGAEAMACMVEQSAYVWYAQARMRDRPVDVDDAARILTRAWYQLFFSQPAGAAK